MAAKIKTALRLLTALDRIDRDIMADVGRYSHAAATTDRVREAARTNLCIGPETADRAIRRAQRDEGRALDTMIETVEDTSIDDRRREAIAAVEAAGIRLHDTRALRCARWPVQCIRDLEVCRSAIRCRTNPAFGRERGAELVAELTRVGIDCTGYLPA